jgi:hypothetical protein
VKFDLFDKALFISAAIFYQERTISTGAGGLTQHPGSHQGRRDRAQLPARSAFLRHRQLLLSAHHARCAAGFYNFPAQPGINYDGAGPLPGIGVGSRTRRSRTRACRSSCSTCSANYKHESGWGVQANIQVTGPVETSPNPVISTWRQHNPAKATRAFRRATGRLRGQRRLLQGAGDSLAIHLNGAVFYTFQKYTAKFSIYNLTDRHNLTQRHRRSTATISSRDSRRRDFDFST